MSLLLPVVILLLTIFAMAGASRIQTDFRSSWLVALGGSILCLLALLVLRFRVPLGADFSVFSINEQINFPLSLNLTAFSWPVAAALVVLLLAGQLGDVRRGVNADWTYWALAVLLGAAALLVAVSGDLLVFACSCFLLDVSILVIRLTSSEDVAQHHHAISIFAVNAVSVMLTLAAWGLSFDWPWISNGFLLVPVAMRIGLFTPRLSNLQSPTKRLDLELMLRFAVPVSALGLLTLSSPLSHLTALAVWLVLILGAGLIFVLHSARQWLPPALASSRGRFLTPKRPVNVTSFLYRPIQWTLGLAATLLEGEAGVLWALLIVALLLSFVIQFGVAG